MNDKQIALLWIVATVIFTLLVFPPYEVRGYGASSQAITESGYAFIFQLPDRSTINASTLLAQWVGVLLAGGCVFFALTKRNQA